MGNSIYEISKPGDKSWISTETIEEHLKKKLIGLDLSPYPIKTRSKVVKTAICKALGYEVPKVFKKTKPRFPCQNLDVYIQKSKNLQVWNEDLDSSRRYAIIKLNERSIVQNIRVVTGNALIPLDRTGKLTQKYQATYRKEKGQSLLLSSDSIRLNDWLSQNPSNMDFSNVEPTAPPEKGKVYPINTIFEKLKKLLGTPLPFAGKDQERNRGSKLHKLVCKSLGYGIYKDSGQFPDLLHQMLEIKLQTSPTIDLGLVLPSSKLEIQGTDRLKNCDVRYVLFYSSIFDDKSIQLTNLLISSGERFFDHFSQFEGKGLNKKIQIPLPKNFFD